VSPKICAILLTTILANQYKTKVITEAKIKSDKLDAKILADLLRTGLVYESNVPAKEFREKREVLSDTESHWSETKRCTGNQYTNISPRYDIMTLINVIIKIRDEEDIKYSFYITDSIIINYYIFKLIRA